MKHFRIYGDFNNKGSFTSKNITIISDSNINLSKIINSNSILNIKQGLDINLFNMLMLLIRIRNLELDGDLGFDYNFPISL